MIELKTKYTPYEEQHNRSKHMDFNHWLFRFPNGYGASVVCHLINERVMTYGNANQPFDLAVIFFDEDDRYEITYNTPVANDVIGYLTEKDIEEYLERIEKLEE